MSRGARYAYKGEMLTISELKKRTGLCKSYIYARLKESPDNDAEKALNGCAPKGRALHKFHGEMLTLREIAERTGISISTIDWRMRRYAVSAEIAADKAVAPACGRYYYKGRWLSVAEIARMSGVSAGTLLKRIKVHGASAEEAADAGYIAPQYTLNGITVTLAMAARRAGIPAAEIRARMVKGTVALDEIVRGLRMERYDKPEPEPEPPEEAEKESTWHREARKIFEQLFHSNVIKRDMVEVIEGRVYRIDGELLRYEVRFDGRHSACMTATEPKTGYVWMGRKYTV